LGSPFSITQFWVGGRCPACQPKGGTIFGFYADGSITYIVKSGDTTLAIALAYGISLGELLKLNGLTAKSVIYPNQKLIIRAAYTPTPTLPTSTPTKIPSITSWPTPTQTTTETSIPSTPTRSPGLPVSSARDAVLIIVIAALGIAAFLSLLGHKRKLIN